MSSSKEKQGQLEKANASPLKLTNSDLSRIKEMAHTLFIESHGQDMDESQFRTFCFVKATLDFLHGNGIELDVQFTKRTLVETLD